MSTKPPRRAVLGVRAIVVIILVLMVSMPLVGSLRAQPVALASDKVAAEARLPAHLRSLLMWAGIAGMVGMVTLRRRP